MNKKKQTNKITDPSLPTFADFIEYHKNLLQNSRAWFKTHKNAKQRISVGNVCTRYREHTEKNMRDKASLHTNVCRSGTHAEKKEPD